MRGSWCSRAPISEKACEFFCATKYAGTSFSSWCVSPGGRRACTPCSSVTSPPWGAPWTPSTAPMVRRLRGGERTPGAGAPDGVCPLDTNTTGRHRDLLTANLGMLQCEVFGKLDLEDPPVLMHHRWPPRVPVGPQHRPPGPCAPLSCTRWR